MSPDERRQFAQTGHEYLIETPPETPETPPHNNYQLSFNHPVRELLFMNSLNIPFNMFPENHSPSGVVNSNRILY